MTTINTTILSMNLNTDEESENYDEYDAVVSHQGYDGVVVEFLGKTFQIEEIEKLLSHMRYLDNLEGEG